MFENYVDLLGFGHRSLILKYAHHLLYLNNLFICYIVILVIGGKIYRKFDHWKEFKTWTSSIDLYFIGLSVELITNISY